jgi:hypothetical protein
MVAGLIVPIAFLAGLAVHVLALERFPNSGDENAYLWQAQAFAQGRITASSPQPAEAFRLSHVGDVAGRRFSKYPPGWPLLLSAGVLAGIPGAVNPLLAALALAGIYRLGCVWIGRRAALLGALVVLATPFFMLNAGSYHSHPSCLFALTALGLCLTWAEERGAAAAFVLAGTAFGLSVLIRPFSALLVGIPMLVAFVPSLARGQGRARKVLLFGLGGLPCALFLTTVNLSVTGTWWRMAWSLYDNSETIGFGSYGHTPLGGLKTMLRLTAEGVLYTSVLGAFLLVLGWGHRFRRQNLARILLVAPVVGHVFWWSHGGNRYGPRFYFEALLPFALFAGAGLEWVQQWKRFRAVALAGSAAWVIVAAMLLTQAHRQVHDRRDVYRTVEAAGLTNAVVLLTTASSDMVRIDLTRNPPDFQRAAVLFALARGPHDREVKQAYPDRSFYSYRWAPEGGVLTAAQFE